jgi:hypothetical protein
VASVAEAHAQLVRRRELENSRRGVLAELKSLKATDDPPAACAEVKSVLAQIEASIAAALAATSRTALPSQAEVDADRLQYDQKRSALDARCASLDAAREEQQEAVETAVAQRTGAQTKLEMVRQSIAKFIPREQQYFTLSTQTNTVPAMPETVNPRKSPEAPKLFR